MTYIPIGNITIGSCCCKQPDENNILKGILKHEDSFHAVMCNPPFFKSAEEAQGANKRKNKNLGNNTANQCF